MSTAEPPVPLRYRDRVRVSEPATQLNWGAAEIIAVLAIPLMFTTFWISTQFTSDLATRVLIDTGLRVVLAVVLAVANRRVLAAHWKAFWKGGWRSVLLVVAGMIVLQLAITLVRTLQGSGSSTADTTGGDDTAALAFSVLLIASFGPTVTALIEDFTFRHTLLMRLPVWRHAALGALVVVVNALLFGAIHINNFGGDWFSTLQYAAAGLIMNLLYLWVRNIWSVLLMHALNNFLLGGPLIVALVHLLGAS